MQHIATEMANVALAADALDTTSLDVLIQVHARQADNYAGTDPAVAEMFHSVCRLLARVRDVNAERQKALRRANRRIALTMPRNAETEISRDFAALVAVLDN